jgi:hypothetical protein
LDLQDPFDGLERIALRGHTSISPPSGGLSSATYSSGG